jgi:hypothetical protein
MNWHEDVTFLLVPCSSPGIDRKHPNILLIVLSTLPVGIVIGYGLGDPGVRVRFAIRSRIFTSHYRPDRLCGPPSLLSNGYRGSFPGGKAAGARS